jgi:hypothetical protein
MSGVLHVAAPSDNGDADRRSPRSRNLDTRPAPGGGGGLIPESRAERAGLSRRAMGDNARGATMALRNYTLALLVTACRLVDVKRAARTAHSDLRPNRGFVESPEGGYGGRHVIHSRGGRSKLGRSRRGGDSGQGAAGRHSPNPTYGNGSSRAVPEFATCTV